METFYYKALKPNFMNYLLKATLHSPFHTWPFVPVDFPLALIHQVITGKVYIALFSVLRFCIFSLFIVGALAYLPLLPDFFSYIIALQTFSQRLARHIPTSYLGA